MHVGPAKWKPFAFLKKETNVSFFSILSKTMTKSVEDMALMGLNIKIELRLFLIYSDKYTVLTLRQNSKCSLKGSCSVWECQNL